MIKMDQSEIELWEKIAKTVSNKNCKKIIQMMIKKEREGMETLRMLINMDDSCPSYDPGCGPDYRPGYDPGYDPGHDPGYGPGKKPYYGSPSDPMPYVKDEREEE